MAIFLIIWAMFCLFIFLFIGGANMKPKENIPPLKMQETDLPPIPYEFYLEEL